MTLPVLYILMRNDLNSLTPGKAMAQSSHASNAFVKHIERHTQNINAQSNIKTKDHDIIRSFRDWEFCTAQGFGTVLVLEAPMREIQPRVDMFKSMGYIADIVFDPTYPIVDGAIVHHIPIDTCAYVFVTDKDTDMIAKTLLCSFPLHK